MKKFFVNGSKANWANLNVTALNVKSGILYDETEIPENLKLQVTIADKFDTNAPDSEALSLATSEYAIRHGKRRHFLLLNGNRVVGWAAFHRKEQEYTVKVDYYEPTSDYISVTAKSEREALNLAAREFGKTHDAEIAGISLAEDGEDEAIELEVDF